MLITESESWNPLIHKKDSIPDLLGYTRVLEQHRSYVV